MIEVKKSRIKIFQLLLENFILKNGSVMAIVVIPVVPALGSPAELNT